MTCPAGVSGSWQDKLTTMTNLVSQLTLHNSLGGTYSVITPSFIYTNCIMTTMRDVSGGETRQPQYRWQFDFMQPLITTQQAEQTQSNFMQKLSNGATLPAGQPTWSSGTPVANPTNVFTSSLGSPTLPAPTFEQP